MSDGYWINCDGCGRLLFSEDNCGCQSELVDHLETAVRGFVVRLGHDRRVVWCSDWATLTREHARGHLGGAVRHVHHGPDTFGAVSYYVSAWVSCDGCDAVAVTLYGEAASSLLFVEWDVMGDSRSFVPVCETCADWHDQNVTLELGGVRS